MSPGVYLSEVNSETGIEPGDAARFESVAGHEMRAQVDVHTVLVGNLKLMDKGRVDFIGLRVRAPTLAEEGNSQCL